MEKNNLVFGLCGIVIGIILGVFLANQTIQKSQPDIATIQQAPSQVAEKQDLPEGHPQIDKDMLTKKIAEQHQILQGDPENPEAIVTLANLYYDLNNFTHASQWYEKALKKDPNNINLITDLGTSYLQLEQVEKSIEMYKKALSINPKHYQTLMNLGIARMSAGDNAGAAEAWEKLIAYYPDDPNLGMIKDALQKMKAEG